MYFKNLNSNSGVYVIYNVRHLNFFIFLGFWGFGVLGFWVGRGRTDSSGVVFGSMGSGREVDVRIPVESFSVRWVLRGTRTYGF